MPFSYRLFALALCLLLTPVHGHADDFPIAATATDTTVATDTFQLPSPAFAPQTFHITVYLPPGYEQ
jgi:hypothetical protein